MTHVLFLKCLRLPDAVKSFDSKYNIGYCKYAIYCIADASPTLSDVRPFGPNREEFEWLIGSQVAVSFYSYNVDAHLDRIVRSLNG